jgi:hypothetical protein
VIPAAGWEDSLYNIIQQIESQQTTRYALALYEPKMGLAEPQQGKPFALYSSGTFFGCQAMYYPDTVREGFATYLKTHAVDSFRCTYDLLLGEYAEREDFPIFVTIPCLVEHIGEVSTGLAQFFHQAKHFKSEI